MASRLCLTLDTAGLDALGERSLLEFVRGQ
jgi:hypothetical protein